MTRRCSHCSNNGHNSRTCPTRSGGGGGVRLFGVRLTEGVGTMKKSASMGCLSSLALASASPGASPSGDALGDLHNAGGAHASGYASDDPVHASSSSSRSERKKGTPWTEKEHRMFLLGLQKLGKGDWRGIAKNFVVTRTPTQVASHAQKYFIRQSNASRRKRRSSLFDMVPEMPIDQVPVHEENFMPQSPPNEPENTNELPPLHLGPQQGPEIVDPLKTNHAAEPKESVIYNNTPMTMVPTFYHAFIPVPLPFWPSALPTSVQHQEMGETYEVVKPTPVIPKEPVNVDEVIGMSKLSIGDGTGARMEPSPLSFKLLSTSNSRQSAFHVNPSIGGPDLNQSSNSPIHAV